MNTAVLRRGASVYAASILSAVRDYGAGTAVSVALALTALAINSWLGGPAMIHALLLGFVLRWAVSGRRFDAGIDFSAKTLLRLGVGLLGAGISFQQVLALGPQVVALVAGGVVFTIILGLICARLLGLGRDLGLLLGGAVAICGASAALAIASVLPKSERSDANTLLAVVGVTALSTIAMVLYPLASIALVMSAKASGVFFGATIHDVAQVVGAGYMISDHTGETATIVKLLRVGCLVPVVAAISLWTGNSHKDRTRSIGHLFPWFLGLFILLSAVASLQLVPNAIMDMVSSAAKILLLIAIAALGLKTSPSGLAKVGIKPVLVLAVATLGLALLVLTLLFFLPEHFA
ncbi:putative sulfate exporter family transporter [Parasphingopyxis algicola]|uniref:YeiH family protein n=1 Tax=Parasphingopyxis algicola TaxID=2026624 RepID=UPI00159FB019|nr:putative sulfate exporter family transporter [Parasphingopyxis algicola]QLC23908.1 putative sulfate exporter family transporter [Parasphingopyxis algicola]